MGKLFILTRKDLPIAYQAVQGGHALAQWMIENPDNTWNNHTLVYLSVPTEAHLEHWCKKLEFNGHNYSKFCEPDINNQLTAIACYTNSKIFGNLKLLENDEVVQRQNNNL